MYARPHWILFLLLFLLLPQKAWAHGEGDGLHTLLESRPVGPYEVSVAGDPRLGVFPLAIHISTDGVPVSERVAVSVEALHLEGTEVVRTEATRLEDEYLAILNLPEAGHWSLRVMIDGDEGYAATTLTAQVTPPRPESNPLVLVLLSLLPPAALLLAVGTLRRLGVAILSADADERVETA